MFVTEFTMANVPRFVGREKQNVDVRLNVA
jgi:hypothetical protein